MSYRGPETGHGPIYELFSPGRSRGFKISLSPTSSNDKYPLKIGNIFIRPCCEQGFDSAAPRRRILLSAIAKTVGGPEKLGRLKLRAPQVDPGPFKKQLPQHFLFGAPGRPVQRRSAVTAAMMDVGPALEMKKSERAGVQADGGSQRETRAGRPRFAVDRRSCLEKNLGALLGLLLGQRAGEDVIGAGAADEPAVQIPIGAPCPYRPVRDSLPAEAAVTRNSSQRSTR